MKEPDPRPIPQPVVRGKDQRRGDWTKNSDPGGIAPGIIASDTRLPRLVGGMELERTPAPSKPRKKTAQIPAETAESLALWERVVPAERRPRSCPKCGQEAVPVLQPVADHIVAYCRHCGRHQKFLRQIMPDDPQEVREAKFRQWSKEEREKGYRQGYAVCRYMATFGEYPLMAWQDRGPVPARQGAA
jgi:hypothetical protein